MDALGETEALGESETEGLTEDEGLPAFGISNSNQLTCVLTVPPPDVYV